MAFEECYSKETTYEDKTIWLILAIIVITVVVIAVVVTLILLLRRRNDKPKGNSQSESLLTKKSFLQSNTESTETTKTSIKIAAKAKTIDQNFGQ